MPCINQGSRAPEPDIHNSSYLEPQTTRHSHGCFPMLVRNHYITNGSLGMLPCKFLVVWCYRYMLSRSWVRHFFSTCPLVDHHLPYLIPFSETPISLTTQLCIPLFPSYFWVFYPTPVKWWLSQPTKFNGSSGRTQ